MRNPIYRRTPEAEARRCPECRLARAACLCGLIPRVETRTRVVLILHQLELRKTTNTGRLALRCLPNGEVVIRGDSTRARSPRWRAAPALSTSGVSPSSATEQPPVDWTAHGDPVLLFPHEDARPIEEWRDNARPVTLIVPDGTWPQGQRVRHRIAGLDRVPCATISRSAPSRYRLRTTADPRRVSTLEAIAEALGALEGDAPRDALLGIFEVMVARVLKARAGGP